MNAEEFKDILSIAIDREVEAYTFYRDVAERANDVNLRKLFNELAGDEQQHRETLEDMLTKGVSSVKFDPSRDYNVVETLDAPKLTLDLKPIDGLIIAIRKELEAMQMYTQLAAVQGDEEKNKVFLELANMERGHKARLEDIYTNMAFVEAW
ncbi:MAG: ferritin family protein [Methanomicrobiaceae archaeon]|nr:ferritin family protein [Methanomicrobiaceae archaeon]